MHNVETLLKEFDQPALEAAMLQLRRNEKDFMLRRELSYVETFDINIGKFNDKLHASSIDIDTQRKIEELITQYHKDFKSLINKEQQLGLTEKDGTMARVLAAN